MKKLSLLLLCSFLSIAIFAQDNTPPYKRHQGVPPFTIEKPGGGIFNKSQLKKEAPVMIMFFSPQCDHCQKQTQELVAKIGKLKNAELVLASYQPMAELQAFARQYKLTNHGNIHIGRDAQFFLPPFYKIGGLPFIATYDKKGELVNVHEGNVEVDKLIAELNR